MSITIINYIHDMKTCSATSTYQRKLIEDTKRHVNHDGDWKRINKDLAMMNHTLEKSKQKS
jgi:hypothetical protein